MPIPNCLLYDPLTVKYSDLHLVLFEKLLFDPKPIF